MEIERVWYEVSPFIYTAVSGFMLGRSESFLLAASSLMLLSAGGTILLLRRKYALQLMQDAKKAKRSSAHMAAPLKSEADHHTKLH